MGNKKAMVVARHITEATPLNIIIRGILSAHYAFKTQPKGKKDFHNKARWSNMKWWDKFIDQMPQIPLRVTKEKLTMENKAHWLDQSVSKSLAMLYTTYTDAYSKDDADNYLSELLHHGMGKLSNIDKAMVEQRVHELLGTDEY